VILADLRTAFTLLTRIPVGLGAAPPTIARAVWAFPIVGLTVGALGGLVYWGTQRLGMSPLLGGCWSIAAIVIATGAFHEDGLADVADGFGGGATRQRKLEIMRDSRLGSYGTLALIFSALIRVSAVAALARPDKVIPALILAAMLGRSGIIVILLISKPARADGIASSLNHLPRASALIGLALAIGATVLLLPKILAATIIATTLAVSLAVAGLARRQIGGHTGDVLGTSVVVIECAVMSVLACFAAG
jgi:adenosylcobinamide-GDP ribazoletransferase